MLAALYRLKPPGDCLPAPKPVALAAPLKPKPPAEPLKLPKPGPGWKGSNMERLHCGGLEFAPPGGTGGCAGG